MSFVISGFEIATSLAFDSSDNAIGGNCLTTSWIVNGFAALTFGINVIGVDMISPIASVAKIVVVVFVLLFLKLIFVIVQYILNKIIKSSSHLCKYDHVSTIMLVTMVSNIRYQN